MPRQEFEITQEDLDVLLKACEPVVYIVFGGIEPISQQENANTAWKKLGDKMGFDWTTVLSNSKGDRFFTAEPKP